MKKKANTITQTLMTLLLIVAFAPIGQATTYHVSTTGDDSKDGETWGDAFKTLSKAINTAGIGDTIWVAEGTYLPTENSAGNTPTDPRNATFFFDKDIEIYDGFPNTGDPGMTDRDWEAYPTILSGDFDGDDIPVTDMEDANFPAENNGENAYTIVHTKNVSSAFIMDGFMINGGNANGSGALPTFRGGGWFNDGSGTGNVSSPTIANCSFSNSNATSFGGAVYNDGFNGTSSPSFSNCSFSYSNADRDGGAVYNNGFQGTSSPSFTQGC